jgi:hypothetical protein
MLFILIIITFERGKRSKTNSSKNLSRKSTKGQSKNKILASFKVYVHVDDSPNFSTGFFQTSDLQTPDTDLKKKGFLINFSQIQNDLKSILRRVEQSNVYMIPYTKLSHTFTFVNPKFAGKYLTNIIKVKPKGFKALKIRFDYNKVNPVISDNELTSIIGWVNNNRQLRITQWIKLKSQAYSYTNQFYANQKALNAVKKGVSEVDAQVTKFTNKIGLLQKKQNIDFDLFNYMNQGITLKEKELAELKSQRGKLLFAMNSRINLINIQQEVAKELTLQKTANALAPLQFKTKTDTAKASLLTILKTISKETPTSQGLVNSAIDALTKQVDLAKTTKLLDKVTP